VKTRKSHIELKMPLVNIFKQLIEDKKDIQEKLRTGRDNELKEKYKVVQPL